MGMLQVIVTHWRLCCATMLMFSLSPSWDLAGQSAVSDPDEPPFISGTAQDVVSALAGEPNQTPPLSEDLSARLARSLSHGLVIDGRR